MRIETEQIMQKYKDNVFAVAFNICKSAVDADDVVQDTFVAYHTGSKQFHDEEHAKAWLLRVAINKSISVTRSYWRRKTVPLDDYLETLSFETPESQLLFTEVMKLPEKLRVVVHLFYYEDYTIKQISSILGISESNVKTRLSRGRKQLKRALKEEWDDDEQF